MRVESRHTLAVILLLVACVGWGLSFPLVQVLIAHQSMASGESGAWMTMQSQMVRFAAAAILLAGLAWWRSHRLPTRAEWIQAAVCASGATAGLFLQVDALHRTSASTVSFLTQSYVVVLPLIAGLRLRQWPSLVVVSSVILAFAGVAVLSGITLQDLRPGLGEMMTIAASLLFMVQILALGARRWQSNDGLQVCWAMFGFIALIYVPFAAMLGPGFGGLAAVYHHPASGLLMAAVVVCCTCAPYWLMTVWQRHVSGTEAGIIYCFEAVFSAIACVFLLSFLGRVMGTASVDEPVTWRMVAGGGLILAGCILVQRAPTPAAPPAETVTKP